MALTRERAGTLYKPMSGQIADHISDNLLVATGQQIFKGGLVSRNAAGFLVVAGDNAGDVFIGIAYDATVGTTTSNGGQSIRVVRRGTIKLTLTGAAQTDVDQTALAVDDETVALTSTNNVAVGVIRYLDTVANTVWVGFDTEARVG